MLKVLVGIVFVALGTWLCAVHPLAMVVGVAASFFGGYLIGEGLVESM